MSDIYVISYFEHPASMGGRGSKTIVGYVESKYEADEYIKKKGADGYGEYISKKVSPLHNIRG